MTEYDQMSEANSDSRLEAWLAEAPQLPASPEFCDQVMRRIETRRQSNWLVQLRQFLLMPHMLRWNIAGATAFVMVISAAVVLTLSLQTKPLSQMVATNTGSAPIEVQFQLQSPGARQVSLAGSFTQWQPKIKLKQNSDGVWVAEVPLSPGDYEYMFVVDGKQWIADPKAARYRQDGFGNRNTVLTVLKGTVI